MKHMIFLLIGIIILGCTKVIDEDLLEENVEIGELILELSNDNYSLRSNASNRLVEIGERALPYIISSLEGDSYNDTSSESFNSRWNKVNVLGRIGSNEAEDVLIDRILNDEETHVRWRSIWALNIVKDENTKYKLIEALKNEKMKWRAAVVLGSFKDENSRDVLLEGLSSNDNWIKWEAVYVLGILGDPSTSKSVSELLDDNVERIRQEAALTLGKLGNKEIIPALVNALQDESPDVRWRAASSLAKLKDKSVIPDIEKALEKEKDEDAYDYMEKALERLKG